MGFLHQNQTETAWRAQNTVDYTGSYRVWSYKARVRFLLTPKIVKKKRLIINQLVAWNKKMRIEGDDFNDGVIKIFTYSNIIQKRATQTFFE